MKIATTRVETFSDGVIAIIITIMVLSLKIPDINHRESDWTIRHHLKELIPYFITYAFSFMMIGIFWINHHHMFHLIEKADESLLIQNLVFLFWMSIIPISTAIMGANLLSSDAVALYAAIMLMTTLTLAIMRTYTIKKNLVHKDRDKRITHEIRSVSTRARRKNMIATGAYLLAVPLAYINVYIAYLLFLVPPVLFFIPDGIDDENLAEKVGEKN
jgi:uncharacterized membrane protein